MCEKMYLKLNKVNRLFYDHELALREGRYDLRDYEAYRDYTFPKQLILFDISLIRYKFHKHL